MIALFGCDEYSLLGIATLLDVEKIPYRRVATVEAGRGTPLLVVGSALSPHEIAALERERVVVLNGGPLFARQVFGAVAPVVASRPCAIALGDPIWPAATAKLARSFGMAALHLPLAPVCETADVSRGLPLAFLSGSNRPAILQRDRLLWSTVDFGAAFANLLTESYLPPHKQHGPPSLLKQQLRRAAEKAYYAAPQPVRRWIQGRSYERLERQLEAEHERFSESLIDGTGWLLIELLRSLVRRTTGVVVGLEKWPAPYQAAATLTHDIEPRRYAYTAGLDRLLKQVTSLGHPATFGLVANACTRYLSDTAAAELRDHAVMCHGLEHRGETVYGRTEVLASTHRARALLEQRLGRPITGYRSPRLDRSVDLRWALDQQGFRFDSSYPDVDRENLRHFGGGVRINLPFRAPIADPSEGLRPSRCLELPLTAPDCVQPLFAGQTVDRLRASIAAKAAFVRATGGLYVALVHGGVFGEPDARLRDQHLRFVSDELSQSGVWLAGIEEVVDWWCAREALQLSANERVVSVRNAGSRSIAGVRLVIDQPAERLVVPLPPLDAGAEMMISISTAAPLSLADACALQHSSAVAPQAH